MNGGLRVLSSRRVHGHNRRPWRHLRVVRIDGLDLRHAGPRRALRLVAAQLVNRLKAQRRPGEGYSDVILRIAAEEGSRDPGRGHADTVAFQDMA